MSLIAMPRRAFDALVAGGVVDRAGSTTGYCSSRVTVNQFVLALAEAVPAAPRERADDRAMIDVGRALFAGLVKAKVVVEPGYLVSSPADGV